MTLRLRAFVRWGEGGEQAENIGCDERQCVSLFLSVCNTLS